MMESTNSEPAQSAKKLEPDHEDKVSRNKLDVFDFDSSESDETENGDQDHLRAKDYILILNLQCQKALCQIAGQIAGK